MFCYRLDCNSTADKIVTWRHVGYRGNDKMCTRHAEISRAWAKSILPVRYAVR